MSVSTVASTTIICPVCNITKDWASTTTIFIGSNLEAVEICTRCHYQTKHQSTTTKWRFDAMPSLEGAVA